MTQEFHSVPTLAEGTDEVTEPVVESTPDEATVFDTPVVVAVDTPDGRQKHVVDGWHYDGSALVLTLADAEVARFEGDTWVGCGVTGEPVS